MGSPIPPLAPPLSVSLLRFPLLRCCCPLRLAALIMSSLLRNLPRMDHAAASFLFSPRDYLLAVLRVRRVA